MNRITEIIVRALTGAVVSAVPAWPPAAGAQATPERSGPWAYSHQPAPDRPMQMATTPAAEDANVWLLLVCDGARLNAAVMHAAGFPYAITPESAIVLRFAGHPDVTAEALPVGESQVSIAGAAARHLLPLVIESERVNVSIVASDGGSRDYTFSLQPNGVALAGIVRDCWDDR